ncbi:MAG: 4Fe-4S binding protein, partial [Deltaproteobacteria bacterium]|nr:4Fe-4S binding protein [Deltaproteobacteria bacterium]
DPACAEACPAEAITKLEETGMVVVSNDDCTGCGECIPACPAGCIFMDAAGELALSCDLCGGEPQCVPLCHSQSLTLSEARVGDEKEGQRVDRLAGLLVESQKASRTTGG